MVVVVGGHEEEDLPPGFRISVRPSPDPVQLDAAEVMVAGKPAAAPGDDHRRVKETRTTLLECVPPSKTIPHRQLPAQVEFPAKEDQLAKVKRQTLAKTELTVELGNCSRC